jgi:hypothetical protein
VKILVTGMTSRQANSRSAARAVNFTSLLVDALQVEPNEVHWLEPDVTWTREFLDDYDQVIVGVSPLLSLASNRVYGALNVIGHMWDDGPLTLFLDAPDAKKVATNLKVVSANPETLTKKFFSYRKGYAQACVATKRNHLVRTVEVLASSDWPTTLVPALPWQTPETRPFWSAQTMVGGGYLALITPDAFIEPSTLPLSAKKRRWAVENMKSDWYRRLGVTWPVEALTGAAWTNDVHALKVLGGSSATLIEPTRSGAFWTPRYRQALLTLAPVYSDWSETSVLGSSWELLPAAIEELRSGALTLLAEAQLEEYMARAPSAYDLYDQLTSALTLR